MKSELMVTMLIHKNIYIINNNKNKSYFSMVCFLKHFVNYYIKIMVFYIIIYNFCKKQLKKIKNNYYFFRISTGTTGAYMLTSTTINGIALDASGRASKSGSNLRKLKLMTEANNIVEKISRPGMNKMQRLRASFDYVKKQYTYYCWREFRNTQDWEKDFAEDMFFRGGRGDCVSYAAAFAYLANAVGMKKVYVICSGGHGWAEIGGKVYDPDWALVSSVDSYFAMSYDLSGVNGRPMYRGNRLYVKKI